MLIFTNETRCRSHETQTSSSLSQPLVYPALGNAAKHHVRREKKTLNRAQCRAGVHLEPVYPRALTDLKTPSAHSNSKA